MPPESNQRLAREIFKEMVESKSESATGATTPIVQAVAARLKAEGFPASDIFVGGTIPTKANLVVRYHGTGARKPILLLAHIDVVAANREDWSMDPFTFIEKDGYFYGRGTTDDKSQAAIWIANLIRYKREGFKPDRDLIVALTADEEDPGPDNGVKWLLKNHRDLIDSDFALNEGGDGVLVNGKHVSNDISAAEKSYADLTLEVLNKGGHSSQPVADNAIYHLAGALTRIGNFTFPFRLNEVTRAYLQQMAKLESGQLSKDLAQASKGSVEAMRRVAAASPYFAAMMRTTCVATMLEGGHAVNALPQSARSNVNCRILPDDSPENVLATLKKVVADDQVTLTIKADDRGPASPLRQDVMDAVTRLTGSMWPGTIALPTMLVGTTDGMFLRAAGIPTYGFSSLFQERDDVRAHGRDERLSVKSFYEGQTFMYEIVKLLAKGAE
jgi:acetylornithine deacetylase/succinyl-diaminopimelate desuccinylase-like protein